MRTDGNGIDADELERILSSTLTSGSKMPKVLYTVPTGCNPTGETADEERKAKV